MIEQKFKIVMARHAESEWNKMSRDIVEKGIETNPAIHLKEQDFEPIELYVDSRITDIGQEQALALAKSVLEYLDHVELILLSPNKRVFQTFNTCFSKLRELGHSEKIDALQIKVCPYLMPALTDIIDFPLEYPESKTILASYNVDFSEMDEVYNGKMWFIDFMMKFAAGKNKKLERLQIAKDAYIKNNNVKDFFHAVTDIIPKKLDDKKIIKKRLKAFKNYLRTNYQKYSNGKILALTHSGIIKRLFKCETPGNASCEVYEFKNKVPVDA